MIMLMGTSLLTIPPSLSRNEIFAKWVFGLASDHYPLANEDGILSAQR
jgi:hypothetical protein